jgi:hypothetical protein
VPLQYEIARDWLLTKGDIGALPITKFGGVPWWPKKQPRPRCSKSHPMDFVAQVCLADVPSWKHDSGLLSFHYCKQCMGEGNMAWGWEDDDKRYDVSVFDLTQSRDSDGLGIVGMLNDTSYMVRFYDYAIPVGLQEASTEWYKDADPEDALDQQEYDEQMRHDFILRQEHGLILVGTPPKPLPPPDISNEDVYRVDWKEFALGYGNRSRIGGPPSWVQNAEFPLNPSGDPMLFIAQIDWVLGHEYGWGGGGYAYLFVDPGNHHPRHGELVVLTT